MKLITPISLTLLLGCAAACGEAANDTDPGELKQSGRPETDENDNSNSPTPPDTGSDEAEGDGKDKDSDAKEPGNAEMKAWNSEGADEAEEKAKANDKESNANKPAEEKKATSTTMEEGDTSDAPPPEPEQEEADMDGEMAQMEDASGEMEDVDPGPAGPQPRGADNPPQPGAQIDRAGRPAISTALIATFEADEAKRNATKDAYNAAGVAQWPEYVETIAGSLAILDGLDTVCGNQTLATEDVDRYMPLAEVLADDRLYVLSTSGTCGTYLGLEGEIVGALEPGQGGCGGRTPLDDVIERSYSVLAAGLLAGVDDTITSDDAVHDPNTFPFLAAPNN